MAYETGTSTDVTDLLDKIRVFAIGIGYTVNRWVASGDGFDLSLYHADCGYINFQSEITATTINAVPSTGFNVGNDFYNQPGTATTSSIGVTRTNGLIGPFQNYKLFGTTEYIHAVVEISPGLFANFGFGILDKAWVFTGGLYSYGTHYSTNSRENPEYIYHQIPFANGYSQPAMENWVQCDQEGVSPYWFSGDRSQTYYMRTTMCEYDSVRSRHLFLNGINDASAVPPLFPIEILTKTATNQSRFIGSVRDVRTINMTNIQPGQTITLGSDVWFAFPIKRKIVGPNPPSGEYSSGIYGMAYKQIL